MILGITGGVGCGKSTVLEYLRNRYGAFLIECDEVARQLQTPGEVCYEPMLKLFSGRRGPEDGPPLLNGDGSFNRKALASLVFSDRKLLEELNHIVHPEVKKRVRELISSYRAQYAKDSSPSHRMLTVIEAALLLDDGYGEICDDIWYIYADEESRRARLKKSRGYTDEKIDDIFRNQRSDESFRSLCDLTIDNSSENLENTFRQLDEALSGRGILPSDCRADETDGRAEQKE